jgi:hypothetical protein
LATITRLNPVKRHEQLRALITSILDTPKAKSYITDWGLELEADLSDVRTRAYLIYSMTNLTV